MTKKQTAGEQTTAYCTKCKLELNHTIVAMKGDKIARVNCLTCNSEHIYKKSPKKKAPGKKRTSPVKRGSSSKNPEVRWEAALAETKGSDIPYNMKRAFKVNDVILHKTFGRGVVLLVSDKRMNLIFKDKERLLASSN